VQQRSLFEAKAYSQTDCAHEISSIALLNVQFGQDMTLPMLLHRTRTVPGVGRFGSSERCTNTFMLPRLGESSTQAILKRRVSQPGFVSRLRPRRVCRRSIAMLALPQSFTHCALLLACGLVLRRTVLGQSDAEVCRSS
jgi:hypothetical protein